VPSEIRVEAFTHTIDGRGATSPASFDVINPATGAAFARCPDASREQLDEAVAAARRAWTPWSRLSFDERRDLLRRFAAGMRVHAEELAQTLVLEQGKTIGECRKELAFVPVQIERLSSIDVADEILRDDPEGRIELRYRPLGVVGIITPWNVPVGIAIGRITQALYTGNTVVQKPSPYTPLATLRMGEIARESFPPGVLNVLAGGNDLGSWMTGHPGIDKISFTGSVPTGKKVLASSSTNLKRVTLELGGNDPAIVLDDVDPQAVAPKLFQAAFANCGQICVAIKRLYVPESIYEPMCQALAAIARSVRVGDGLDPDTQMGPLQNRMQYDKVLGILEDTRRVGARILCGGQALDRPGYFIAPTIVADISEGTRLVDEEPFGPVLPVIKYRHLDDAIRRANDTRYGLSGSVWTNDLARGAEVAARLEVGTAYVNQHRIPDATVPFGGAKESGLGREYSALGLKSYMEAQVVSVSPLTAGPAGTRPEGGTSR
jgi:acyl-CoA reductase-like NAD-dependent aldehyde dehydrogenase